MIEKIQIRPNRATASFFFGIVILLLSSGCATMWKQGRDRERAAVHLQLATDFFTQREYGRALEAIHEAIKTDPTFAPAYNHQALILMETKRYAKSEESFRKALEIQSDYPEVLNNFGVLLIRQERFAEAIPYFEKALASDTYPTPENAYTNLGQAYFKMGQLNKAKSYHQRALDAAPLFCLAAKNLGDVYAKEKNYSQAAEYFQKATTHCPLYQESQYKLGLVLMRMGQRNVARTQLEKLVDRHKNGPYVNRSQEVLRLLK